MASRRLFEAVPFYAGLTLEEIGGRGVRWQEREAAAAYPAGAPRRISRPRWPRRSRPRRRTPPSSPAYRSVWDAPEVEHSPALQFLFPHPALLGSRVRPTLRRAARRPPTRR